MINHIKSFMLNEYDEEPKIINRLPKLENKTGVIYLENIVEENFWDGNGWTYVYKAKFSEDYSVLMDYHIIVCDVEKGELLI